MGHMKEQGIELNNLTMTFPLSGAEAQRALVLVLLLLVSELGFHWTKFSKFFYDIFFPKLILEVLRYCFPIAPQPQCEYSEDRKNQE